MEKERYYIFLDVDGVLYDYAWIKKNNKDVRTIRKFKKESIDALNLLISNLEKKYDVDIVITSTWRLYKFQTLLSMLEYSGLNYAKDIHKTHESIRPFTRGEDILSYLKHRKNPNNYVIIDDESFDFAKYFNTTKIIKPNIQNNALNTEMFTKFLSDNKLLKNDKELTF